VLGALTLVTLLCGPTALAQDRDKPDPDLVLAVGARAAGTFALAGNGWLGADAMAMGSLEVRFDKQTSGRLEAGYNPVRGRIHIGAAGRAYPAGRKGTAWWAELSGHIHRTGARIDPERWEPRAARVWVSLPVLAGAGWRIFAGDNLVVDFGAHFGPNVEIRPQESFPVGFGFTATTHLYVGAGF